MKAENKTYTFGVVDLFCGIGGLSYGLKEAGLDIIAGLDINDKCRFSYESNNKATFITSDLTQYSSKKVDELFNDSKFKILVGCAPCQPFSRYAKRYQKEGLLYDKELGNKEKKDRYYLIDEFLRIIKDISPDVVSLENVPGIEKEKVFEKFISDLAKFGYFVTYKIVYCPDYGVPQKRKRLVLLASKLGEIELIEPTHSPNSYVTVRDAISGLPSIVAGQSNDSDSMHRSAKLSSINVKRIKQSKQGGTWRDWDENLRLKCHIKDSGKSYPSVYGRMEWDKPSPTITTQFYGYGNGRFGHPEQDRALSFREGAILQSFPEKYIFVENSEETVINSRDLGIQIGNAVPPKLGEAIGRSILKHLEGFGDEQRTRTN